jgi:hypothetical protein
MTHITEIDQQDAVLAIVSHVFRSLAPLEQAAFKRNIDVALWPESNDSQEQNEGLANTFSKMPAIRKWIISNHLWFWNHPKMGNGATVTRKSMISYVMDVYPLAPGDHAVLDGATKPRFHDQFGGSIGHKSILGSVLERVDTGEYRVIPPAGAIQ